jgi:hypothetical protein
MTYFVTLIVLSAVTYRVARFIVLDTLVDVPRDKVHGWLELHPNALSRKVLELLGCPWCITIWVSAATVVVHDAVVSDGVAVPVWTWLTVAVGSLLLWHVLDSEPD